MTGDEVRKARAAIGTEMGLGRPLRMVELGRLRVRWTLGLRCGNGA
jgi:hypothetical protein